MDQDNDQHQIVRLILPKQLEKCKKILQKLLKIAFLMVKKNKQQIIT